jgi:hypothetical protein
MHRDTHAVTWYGKLLPSAWSLGMLSQTAGIGQERTLAKPQNSWINRRSDNEKQKERANREVGLIGLLPIRMTPL